MNDERKKCIIHTLSTANAVTQRAIADTIRRMPNRPLYMPDIAVGIDPEALAELQVEEQKLQGMLIYTHCLAWFYAAVFPIHAMDRLIESKLMVTANGKPTEQVWERLDKVATAISENRSF